MKKTFKRKKKNITEKKISSNTIVMEKCNIMTFLEKQPIQHMPAPVHKGTKDFNFNLHWKPYKRKSKKDDWTWAPTFREFKKLTKDEIKSRHKYYQASDTGVIDTYKILQIDIDAPVYDDWLIELLKTAPYYKSQTKKYGKHIFVKLKKGQSLPKTSAYLYDKKSLECGEKKIEIFNGKWCFFDVNRDVYNCNNEIPTIDLNEHPLLKQIDEPKFIDKKGHEKLEKKTTEKKKKVISKRDCAKLKDYSTLIKDRFWETYADWYKIMCAWKFIGATFEQFQEVALTKPGDTKNNKKL